MEKAKRFLFNLEWVEILNELPREVKYEVYDAIMEYVASGTLPDLKPTAKGCFLFIKREIDFNRDQYSSRMSENVEKEESVTKRRGNPKFVKGQANPYYSKGEETVPDKASEIIQDNSGDNSTLFGIIRDNSLSPNNDYDNINVNVSPPYNPPRGNNVATAKENLISEFFSKQAAIEQFCMVNHTTSEELRKLAEEIFNDWELQNEQDISAKHLMNVLRMKLRIRQNNNPYGTDNRTNPERARGPGGYRSKLPPEPGCGLIED